MSNKKRESGSRVVWIEVWTWFYNHILHPANRANQANQLFSWSVQSSSAQLGASPDWTTDTNCWLQLPHRSIYSDGHHVYRYWFLSQTFPRLVNIKAHQSRCRLTTAHHLYRQSSLIYASVVLHTSICVWRHIMRARAF